MRNMLAFLAALTLTLGGVGWYLDWFQIRTTPAPSGQRSVTVDINTRKIGEDLLKAEQKVQKRLEEKAKASAAAEKMVTKPAPLRAPDVPPPDVPPVNIGVMFDR